MKIGFSFGRCVRSIVLGEVDIDDVMCIIARTYMPRENDVKWVIEEYMLRSQYLSGLDRDRCHDVGMQLWRSGRVIEPRQNGVHVMSAPKDCVWMDLYPTVVDNGNTAVKEAWDAYRLLINLAAQVPEPDEAWLRHREKHEEADAANVKPATPEELEAQKKALDLLTNSI